MISCRIVKLPAFWERDLKREEFTEGKHIDISLDDLLAKRLGIADAEIGMVHNIYTILTTRDGSDYDYTYATTMIRTYANLTSRYITQILQAPL
jgi:hypothetical protein